MVVIGMGLLFGAYTIGLYGYCLIVGYDVTFPMLFKTQWKPAQPSTPGSAGGTPSAPGGSGAPVVLV